MRKLRPSVLERALAGEPRRVGRYPTDWKMACANAAAVVEHYGYCSFGMRGPLALRLIRRARRSRIRPSQMLARLLWRALGDV